MEKEKVIEIKGLQKVYRKNHLFKTTKTVALSGLSLTVYRKDIYCLLGLNGSGKTTTVKLLLNLIFPDKGEIFVFSSPPNADSLRRIGYVSENPYLFPYLTGYEFLDLMAILNGFSKSKRKKRIEELCEYFKISGYIKRKIKEYSKGMQQRLLLAQALLHDPQLLIMDEPYSGLDPVGILEMRNYIKELNEKGKTILFTSHIIAEAEKVATRAGILSKGKLKKEFEVIPGNLEKEFMEAIL